MLLYSFYSFVIFLLLVVGIFCGRLICSKEDESTPAEQRAPSQPPPPPQNPATAPVEVTAEVFHRSSLGRILKPVDDEEARISFEEGIVSPQERSSALRQDLNSSSRKLVLSADFGDNEIFAVEETACTICLVDFEHGEAIQRNAVFDIEGGTTCDHIFHPLCISLWIQKSGKEECPCCRRPFHLGAVTGRPFPNTVEC